jgi:histidyl-tRNA synthetase
MAKGHSFQAPTGTRDFYPQDMLRRRYIEKMWRDTSIRHGFEEIDGPTFEHLDLYTVKSGEGIVNELFSFKRAGGEKDYALRPEFTPTLARMYAAKAGGLAKPTKWFTAGPFFRAERPQRGRLREFLQWNVDYIGGEPGTNMRAADVETLCLLVDFFIAMGLEPSNVRIKLGSRDGICLSMSKHGLPPDLQQQVFSLLDERPKIDVEEYRRRALAMGWPHDFIREHDPEDRAIVRMGSTPEQIAKYFEVPIERAKEIYAEQMESGTLSDEIARQGIAEWCEFDSMIIRGLAYYTGVVFEVHEAGGKERAIAGGGRYDNLIELFGGPPTPAVGFGMGDVVLSLVLQDKGLMPEGAALMDKLSEPPASPRPDVFVIPNDQAESIAAVRPLVASLRRGGESARPLHARHSYKATKNIGKLLQEASAAHSRFAAIIESGTEATLKNLATGEQTQKVPVVEVAARVSTPG